MRRLVMPHHWSWLALVELSSSELKVDPRASPQAENSGNNVALMGSTEFRKPTEWRRTYGDIQSASAVEMMIDNTLKTWFSKHSSYCCCRVSMDWFALAVCLRVYISTVSRG